jgi:hypothetical protein
MALILSGDTGVPASGMPTGSVIQTVQATYTGYSGTTSTTFVDTSLSAIITPTSSTSKILVLITTMGSGAANNGIGFSINRNGTNVWTSGYDSGPKYYSAYISSNWNCPVNISYLDSPASSSALTYKLQYAAYNSASSMYWGVANTTHTLQLMEIKG